MPKRPRPNFSDSPLSDASSWLDLYPPNPSKAPRPPPLDPRLRTRITKLTNTLEDLKPSFENRQYFLNLYTNKGQYCSSCTPSNASAGSCGATCTLLRPAHRGAVPKFVTSEYLEGIADSIQTYERVASEVADAGQRRAVRREKVEQWERVVEELRQGTLNESERREERNWPVRQDGMGKGKVQGLDLEWRFERDTRVREGKGRGGEGVAPEGRA